MIPYSQSYAKECEGEWIMKRVVCLLLSLILLLGLLPTFFQPVLFSLFQLSEGATLAERPQLGRFVQ